MGEFTTLAISAVLLAGFYAAMAYGLGLIYGVLRIVNLAHGGIIMAAAYLAWQLFERFRIDRSWPSRSRWSCSSAWAW